MATVALLVPVLTVTTGSVPLRSTSQSPTIAFLAFTWRISITLPELMFTLSTAVTLRSLRAVPSEWPAQMLALAKSPSGFEGMLTVTFPGAQALAAVAGYTA